MAEDQAPDPADQPDEGESKPEPYRLGGSGGPGRVDTGLRRWPADQPVRGPVLLAGRAGT